MNLNTEKTLYLHHGTHFAFPQKVMICFFFFFRSLLCNLSPNPPSNYELLSETCTFEKQLYPVIHGVAIAVVILIFTVERFQQTKHRKLHYFFLLIKCMLFLKIYPSVHSLSLEKNQKMKSKSSNVQF